MSTTARNAPTTGWTPIPTSTIAIFNVCSLPPAKQPGQLRSGLLREPARNHAGGGEWTGEHQYAIDQVLTEMMSRLPRLKLVRRSSTARPRVRDLLVLVTVKP